MAGVYLFTRCAMCNGTRKTVRPITGGDTKVIPVGSDCRFCKTGYVPTGMSQAQLERICDDRDELLLFVDKVGKPEFQAELDAKSDKGREIGRELGNIAREICAKMGSALAGALIKADAIARADKLANGVISSPCPQSPQAAPEGSSPSGSQ